MLQALSRSHPWPSSLPLLPCLVPSDIVRSLLHCLSVCLSVLLPCLSHLSDRFLAFLFIHTHILLLVFFLPLQALPGCWRMSPGSPLLLRCLLSTHPTRLVLVRPVFPPILLCFSPQSLSYCFLTVFLPL